MRPKVAIVDYGLGNLFSVAQACLRVGASPKIVSASNELLDADAVIVPGVGAFGDGMRNLRRLDLVTPLQDLAQSEVPLIGICLGMQLLMTESYEFGNHKGLGVIEGSVRRLPVGKEKTPSGAHRKVKVPHVGWSRVFSVSEDGETEARWESSPLSGLPNGVLFYFVHSYYVDPEGRKAVLSTSNHSNFRFCSSLQRGSVFGCQFHPERSGPQGIKVYENIFGGLLTRKKSNEELHA